MIDFQTETVIPINDVPKHIPGRPHYSTIYRWLDRGVRGVRLESMLIGGARHTSLEALQRFFERTTAAADGQPATPATMTKQRQARIEAAERRLAELGI